MNCEDSEKRRGGGGGGIIINRRSISNDPDTAYEKQLHHHHQSRQQQQQQQQQPAAAAEEAEGGISARLSEQERAYTFNMALNEKSYGSIIYNKKILRIKGTDDLSSAVLSYSEKHLGPSFGLLATYSFLAREYIRIAGLTTSLEAVNSQPAWITEFGTQEDIDARKHYGNVLTYVLMQHVAGNRWHGRCEAVLDFSCPGHRLPAISVRDYVERIMKYTPATKEMYIAVLVYIDRLVALNDGFRVTEQNVHRVVVTAIVVASKFFDDLFYTNKYLASVAGVPVEELNALEIAFLNRIRYNLDIPLDVFAHYRKIFEQIVSFARSNEDLYGFYKTVFSSFRAKLIERHSNSNSVAVSTAAASSSSLSSSSPAVSSSSSSSSSLSATTTITTQTSLSSSASYPTTSATSAAAAVPSAAYSVGKSSFSQFPSPAGAGAGAGAYPSASNYTEQQQQQQQQQYKGRVRSALSAGKVVVVKNDDRHQQQQQQQHRFLGSTRDSSSPTSTILSLSGSIDPSQSSSLVNSLSSSLSSSSTASPKGLLGHHKASTVYVLKDVASMHPTSMSVSAAAQISQAGNCGLRASSYYYQGVTSSSSSSSSSSSAVAASGWSSMNTNNNNNNNNNNNSTNSFGGSSLSGSGYGMRTNTTASMFSNTSSYLPSKLASNDGTNNFYACH